MARIKRAVTALKKRRKVFKLAKGYYGAKSKLYKTANETVIRAQRNSYIGRKQRKRDFRKLWITRINAACRENEISYSRFINGLAKASIDINRKMLSELAISDAKAFAELVKTAKEALEGTLKDEVVKAAPAKKDSGNPESFFITFFRAPCRSFWRPSRLSWRPWPPF